MQQVKYNPAPITERYRIAVFNLEGHGVAEYETLPGQLLQTRMQAAQHVADAIPPGYTVQVFTGVHTIGKSTADNRRIVWN